MLPLFSFLVLNLILFTLTINCLLILLYHINGVFAHFIHIKKNYISEREKNSFEL